jgi:hypothetical protein
VARERGEGGFFQFRINGERTILDETGSDL